MAVAEVAAKRLLKIFIFTNNISLMLLVNNSNSNITAYPQSNLHRGGYFLSIFDTTILPYNKKFNNCRNALCYTQSKGTFIYKPHTAYGMVGTTGAAYIGRRRRL